MLFQVPSYFVCFGLHGRAKLAKENTRVNLHGNFPVPYPVGLKHTLASVIVTV